MTTKPTVPPAAAEAALCAFERGAGYSHRERVRWGLVAALPHLLPGMFVAPDGGDCLTIWAQGDDLTHPVEQMVRTQANAPLFDAVAALLPDRTDEAEAAQADVEAAISESHAAAEAYESYQSEGGEAW